MGIWTIWRGSTSSQGAGSCPGLRRFDHGGQEIVFVIRTWFERKNDNDQGRLLFMSVLRLVYCE